MFATRSKIITTGCRKFYHASQSTRVCPKRPVCVLVCLRARVVRRSRISFYASPMSRASRRHLGSSFPVHKMRWRH